MAAFFCEKVFYVPHQDLVALAGHLESGFVRPGFWVDLPRERRGPGWVVVTHVQQVPFRDGRARLCLLLPWNAFSDAPLMEFTDLEGIALDLRPA
jgi:hypothetical protein